MGDGSVQINHIRNFIGKNVEELECCQNNRKTIFLVANLVEQCLASFQDEEREMSKHSTQTTVAHQKSHMMFLNYLVDILCSEKLGKTHDTSSLYYFILAWLDSHYQEFDHLHFGAPPVPEVEVLRNLTVPR